jgi:thioredoxin 1
MEGPIVAQLAKEEAGLAVVGKVNADDAPELMQKFGIQAIPTLIVFQGGKPVKTFTGLTDGSDLKAAIQEAMRS